MVEIDNLIITKFTRALVNYELAGLDPETAGEQCSNMRW